MKEPLWYKLMWFFPPALFTYFWKRFHGWNPKFIQDEMTRMDAIILEKDGMNK